MILKTEDVICGGRKKHTSPARTCLLGEVVTAPELHIFAKINAIFGVGKFHVTLVPHDSAWFYMENPEKKTP